MTENALVTTEQPGGDAGGSPDGGGSAADPMAFVDNLTPEHVNNAFARMALADKNGAEMLRREWGGDAGNNLRFAVAAFSAFGSEALEADLEAKGFSPALVRAAAAAGRRLAAESGNPRTVVAQENTRAMTETNPTAAQGLIAEAEQARQNRIQAQARGHSGEAQRWDARERELLGQIHGNGPLVGSALRKV